jgi:hypothetical protein
MRIVFEDEEKKNKGREKRIRASETMEYNTSSPSSAISLKIRNLPRETY